MNLTEANSKEVRVSNKHFAFMQAIAQRQQVSVEETFSRLLNSTMKTVTEKNKPVLVGGITPTKDQQIAIDMAVEGHNVKINAIAGSGKTSVLVNIANKLQNKRGLYLTFNRRNAEEAARKFPPNVTCATPHKLAYHAVGVDYQRRLNIGKLKGFDLAKELELHASDGLTRTNMGDIIINIINQYCYSPDREIGEQHITDDDKKFMEKESDDPVFISQALIFYANTAWDMLIRKDCELPITHDIYLKVWGLSNPKLEYNFLLFDESQDANPVLLQVVMQQKTQLIMVGDRYQSCYAFRGAVNAMELIKLDKVAEIKQSFRYGQSIASVASRILSKGTGEDIRIIGNGKIESEITNMPCKVRLCRTNLKLIEVAMELHRTRQDVKIHIIGNQGTNSELVNLLNGAADLKNNNRTMVRELMHFSSWEEVMDYSETDQGKHLASLVGLVNRYPLEQLKHQLIRIGQNRIEDAHVILSTAHKAKGLEFDEVMIENDFPLPGSDRFTNEEMNLLYIAVTRAKKRLNISSCNALSLLS